MTARNETTRRKQRDCVGLAAEMVPPDSVVVGGWRSPRIIEAYYLGATLILHHKRQALSCDGAGGTERRLDPALKARK